MFSLSIGSKRLKQEYIIYVITYIMCNTHRGKHVPKIEFYPPPKPAQFDEQNI